MSARELTELSITRPSARGNALGVPTATGGNRRESPILPPGLSDEEVVSRWLAVKALGRGRLSQTTLAQYRLEAERLFWYARHIAVPISHWTLDEFAAYIGFLQAPAEWAVRRRGVRRGSPEWRPFLGPLSDESAGQTQKIVTSLFEWLRDVGYLQVNPAAGMPTVGRVATEKQSRFYAPEDCTLMREAIGARETNTREATLCQARDLFLVDLFELTGARTIEAMRGRMYDIKIERVSEALRRAYPLAPVFQWLLRVPRGKGGKERWIPCNELALSLQAYRVAFGLAPLPSPDDSTPLVLSVRRGKFGGLLGLRSRTSIWNVIKGLGAEAIAFAQTAGYQLEADAVTRLRQGSTHWIRHTYAKGLASAVKSGRLDERSALENMGHSDRRTFNQYDDDEPLRRALATEAARALTNR
jgi:integrase